MIKSAREKYKIHKYSAKGRGISFELTFEQWMKLWLDSGHWKERGCRHGQYVMARFGDIGPYSIDNVKIITNGENSIEGNIGNTNALGYKHTLEARAKMRGPKSEEHRAKLRKPKSEEHKAKLRASGGHPQSEETKAKIAIGLRFYLQRKRNQQMDGDHA